MGTEENKSITPPGWLPIAPDDHDRLISGSQEEAQSANSAWNSAGTTAAGADVSLFGSSVQDATTFAPKLKDLTRQLENVTGFFLRSDYPDLTTVTETLGHGDQYYISHGRSEHTGAAGSQGRDNPLSGTAATTSVDRTTSLQRLGTDTASLADNYGEFATLLGVSHSPDTNWSSLSPDAGVTPPLTVPSTDQGTLSMTETMAATESTSLGNVWSGNGYDVINATDFFDVNATGYFENMTDWYNGTTADPFHGYPYPSMYSWPHIILSSIVLMIIALVIVLGNGLVIVAVATDRNLKGLQNWFITSLAVSDLFVGLFIMPLSLANEVMGYWYFGNVLCELWLATDVLLCTASILNLCLISLDRYWSVTRAVSYVKQRTKKRAIVMIVLVWGLAMIICFPPLVGWKRPQPIEHGFPLCVLSEETGYVVYSTMGSFYIPLIVMVLVYFKIYLAARARARRNLKKAAPHVTQVPGHSKSTSTSTSTSGGYAGKNRETLATRITTQRDFSSLDEEDDDDLSHVVSSDPGASDKQREGEGEPITTDSGPDPSDQNCIKMTVTNHHAHLLHQDEKRQLLSEETDSACDTPMLKQKPPQLSEDTDSTSDYTHARDPTSGQYRLLKAGDSGSGTGPGGRDENLKPLLEDSQLESDSQRESDGKKKALLANGKTSDTKTTDGSDSTTHHPHNRHHDGGLKPDAERPKSRDRLKPSDARRDKKKQNYLSPVHVKTLRSSIVRKHSKEKPKSAPQRDDPERMKRKIARAKERRATLVLGIIMATFIGCWLPFFSIYLIASLSGAKIPTMFFAVIFWLGYCNSALNPIIYTIFNQDFRKAFHRILFPRRTTF